MSCRQPTPLQVPPFTLFLVRRVTAASAPQTWGELGRTDRADPLLTRKDLLTVHHILAQMAKTFGGLFGGNNRHTGNAPIQATSPQAQTSQLLRFISVLFYYSDSARPTRRMRYKFMMKAVTSGDY